MLSLAVYDRIFIVEEWSIYLNSFWFIVVYAYIGYTMFTSITPNVSMAGKISLYTFILVILCRIILNLVASLSPTFNMAESIVNDWHIDVATWIIVIVVHLFAGIIKWK